MKIYFEFDTDTEEYGTIREKLHELHRVEQLIKAKWAETAETYRQKLAQKHEQWMMADNSF